MLVKAALEAKAARADRAAAGSAGLRSSSRTSATRPSFAARFRLAKAKRATAGSGGTATSRSTTALRVFRRRYDLFDGGIAVLLDTSASPRHVSVIMRRLTTIDLFKEEMMFSAGHFTIFSATHRENLHGHNFDVALSIAGEVDESTGMLADYDIYKRIMVDACKRWHETFLLPTRSPFLVIGENEKGYIVARFDGEEMLFLKRDVSLLPVSNVSLEELARLLGEGLVSHQTELRRDRIREVIVKVASAKGQWCSWKWEDV